MKKVILCVDDEIFILRVLAKDVERIVHNKYEVIQASNGIEALGILKGYATSKNPIKLLISDWHMPLLTGDTLFKESKALSPSTKLIMISGYLQQDAEKELKGIPHMFLAKPYLFNTLSKVVTESLTTN